MTTIGRFEGRARLRCDVRIVHAGGGASVVQGYTIHAFINKEGKPLARPHGSPPSLTMKPIFPPLLAMPVARPI